MTEQRTSPDEMSKFMRDVVPLWMKLIFGGVTLLMAALAAISVLRHGTKNLGFLFMTLSMAGLLFFMDQPTHPIKAYLKRPQGFLYLLWVAVTIVWYMRDVGWLPAVCIGGAYLFAPLGRLQRRQGETWWRYYLHNPLTAISGLLLFLFILWFAWSTGAWVPIICVVATFSFLGRDIRVRRSLKENLARRSFIASLVVLLIAGIWMSTHLSFGTAFAFVFIICLLISDIYLHTSSQEDPLALSHPQS